MGVRAWPAGPLAAVGSGATRSVRGSSEVDLAPAASPGNLCDAKFRAPAPTD